MKRHVELIVSVLMCIFFLAQYEDGLYQDPNIDVLLLVGYRRLRKNYRSTFNS